jgi:hypothetical protein
VDEHAALTAPVAGLSCTVWAAAERLINFIGETILVA